MFYQNYIKRLIDILLSLLGIVVTIIPMLIIAIVIKLDSPGSVLFRQKRVGKGKKYFQILKFRTMRTDAPKDMPTHLLENPDSLITKSGKLLRKTSLDELPQLFNILKGDMSIVGPRPALWNQEDLIELRDSFKKSHGRQFPRNNNPKQKNTALQSNNQQGVELQPEQICTAHNIFNSILITANDLRPGLTGWAQVNGRDELPLEVKAAFDGEYLEKLSFKFDCKCFFKTITSVLKSDGVVEGKTK